VVLKCLSVSEERIESGTEFQIVEAAESKRSQLEIDAPLNWQVATCSSPVVSTEGKRNGFYPFRNPVNQLHIPTTQVPGSNFKFHFTNFS